jgi:type IV secretory pathway VirB3-like protein
MTKRGEPLPINQAMNRPRAKLGLDLSTWMAIVFVNVTVFLVGFRLLAILSFPTMAVAAWLIIRKHPKMFQLWGLSLNQKSYYDPRKHSANQKYPVVREGRSRVQHRSDCTLR